MAWLLLALSCDAEIGDVRGPPGDTATPDDTDPTTDTSPDDTDVPPELVAVSHARELRGAWVATVWSIDWPSDQGLSPDELEGELEAMVDAAAEAHVNALFFQVRAEADAFYDSDLEPWSRWLSGTQGVDPGIDPLERLIALAHPRGIEVHAWMNPYRAGVSSGSSYASNHVSKRLGAAVVRYNGYLWMDPGDAAVQDETVAVIEDVVSRYDVDGVHFDDYFYPYPDDAGTDFPDDATWSAYQRGGGALDREDWRRENVNSLIGRVADTIAAIDPNVRFGIAPFGIYRPGVPSGISGFDAYENLYCDPLAWLDAGDLDYIAPQLYWPSTQTAQAFGTLAEWWADQPSGGAHLFTGSYLAQLGSSSKWTLDEFATEVDLAREAGATGQIWYNFTPILEDWQGVRGEMADWYAAPAATPPVADVAERDVTPPQLTDDGPNVRVAHAETLRAYGVYRQDGSRYVLDRLVPGDATTIPLDGGTWAITAIDRGSVESLGVVVRR
jgi:uncharacterized lipoprotein YddW (UPF0748 family)